LTSKKSGILQRSISEHDVETGFTQSIAVTPESPIYTERSKYQFIEVHESPHFGRILVLDGVTQLTERDADSYNEMMGHIPLFQHSNPKRVLILGGGDGYILHEVLKHASVEHVDHVDLDESVVETCKRFFKWGNAWNDTRVQLHIEDGAKFVERADEGYYDVIIQDSSDPWTSNEKGETVQLPSSSLYASEHFSNIYRALADDGILNLQVSIVLVLEFCCRP
jgi:spermidine synthase